MKIPVLYMHSGPKINLKGWYQPSHLVWCQLYLVLALQHRHRISFLLDLSLMKSKTNLENQQKYYWFHKSQVWIWLDTESLVILEEKKNLSELCKD